MLKIGNLFFEEFPLLLAPMEDVSDPPFRALCKAQGCDMLYTEFISVEGLVRDARKSIQKLDIYEEERPIGIQIFGSNLESMVGSVPIVEAANPDLIDINYGCPVKNVVCNLAGSGALKDVNLMVRLTEGIVKASTKPVTVKTRLGWSESNKNIMEVAERLQDIGIQALSIHGRTREQMYKGEADWTLIGQVKNNPRIHIPIIGNGDIDSPQKAALYRERYGVDGIMIGRAAIGYPWIFREIKHYFRTGELLAPPSLAERLDAARQHLTHSVNWKGEKLGILEMRRHYTNYFRGIPNIKEYRQRLVQVDFPDDVEAILQEIAQNEAIQEAVAKMIETPVLALAG